ncbi:MAG: galactose-1-epimerase [Rhizobiales bacterium]|nr:galactose-1-epimerase [Hyphomicrobiales bacterium]
MTSACRVKTFGNMPDGREVHFAMLTNANGLSARILTLGAILQSVETPDRQGRFSNICLGHDSPEEYLADTNYMGAVIGRYANRIKGAAIRIDGIAHELSANEGAHCLHGGTAGFDKALWHIVSSGPDASITLSHVSPDGDQGFPGELTVEARYELNDRNELQLDIRATTTAPTVVSLAPHPYWNLSGHADRPLRDHSLQIAANKILAVSADKLPTGRIEAVQETGFDFRQSRDLDTSMPLDHCFILKHPSDSKQPVATLKHADSGRIMRLTTTAPALQAYDGHLLPSPLTGIALEPQQYPDAPNQPSFPSPLLRPGEIWRSTTVYSFGLDA